MVYLLIHITDFVLFLKKEEEKNLFSVCLTLTGC